MAIGAILALQQAGKDPKRLVIGGIDATKDALREMERGNLALTVFQDPKAQGIGAVETAVKLTKGEKVNPSCGSRSSWSLRIITRNSFRSSPPPKETPCRRLL